MNNGVTATREPLQNEFEIAASCIAEGQPARGMARIASLLREFPGHEQAYRAAFEALAGAMATPGALSAWDASEKHSCYQQLLLQEKCAARPYVFHHGLASLLTSNNVDTAAALVCEVTPALRLMLEQMPADADTPKPLVLFLLVSRTFRNDWISQDRIAKLHLRHFPEFDVSDFALPYSVMFNSGIFGANRDDLLSYFKSNNPLDSRFRLKAEHLLLLEWLGADIGLSDPINGDFLAEIAARLVLPEYSEESRSAARSLLLHHWPLSTSLDPSVLEEAGLASQLSSIKEVSESENRPERETGALLRLESRPWQAIGVARNFSTRLMSALPFKRRSRKVRVAICISGQLRGYRRAFPTWLRQFLVGTEYDIYVHSWAKIGRAGAQPFRSSLPFEGTAFCAEWRRIGTLEGYEAMQSRYPGLFNALDAEGSATESQLGDFYGARSVVLEQDVDEEFAHFTNQDKMHYKIWAAHQLAVKDESDYDLIIRLRPDLALGFAAFDWRDMVEACQTQPLLFCDTAFGVHYGHPMIGDQIAIGSPETMSAYADTWLNHSDLSGLGLMAYPEALTGHVSLAQTCWIYGIRALRVPLKMQGLLDPELISLSQIQAALEGDSCGRNDESDRALLSAVRIDQKN